MKLACILLTMNAGVAFAEPGTLRHGSLICDYRESVVSVVTTGAMPKDCGNMQLTGPSIVIDYTVVQRLGSGYVVRVDFPKMPAWGNPVQFTYIPKLPGDVEL